MNAIILNYSSLKCKSVARSVLATALYAFVLRLDHKITVRIALQKDRQSFSTTEKVNGFKFFNDLITLNTNSEKRIFIDLSMLRQSYENRKISEVTWIPENQNPADDLIRPCP